MPTTEATEEPKKTRLLSPKESVEPVIAAWEMAHFRTPEEEQAYQLEQEEQEVEQIRLEREEEERLRQKAQEEGYAAGYQKGYEEGLRKGLEDGEQQQEALLQQTAQQMDAAMQAFVEPFAQLEEVVYEKMVALSLAVSQRIVQQSIEQTPEWIISVFKTTLDQLPEVEAQVEVWVHPELESTLEPYLTQQAEHFPQGWRLLADEALPKGAVKIKHQNSTLTSDWQQQLKSVVDQVWQNALSTSESVSSEPT